MMAGRVFADLVAEERAAPRLVECDPVLHSVAEPLGDYVGEFGERIGSRPIGPAASISEHLRQIPMVERGPGRDACLKQSIDKLIVEIQASFIYGSAPIGDDARPGD